MTSYGGQGPIMGSGGSAGNARWGTIANPQATQSMGGVATGGAVPTQDAVQQQQQQGPSLADIQAEQARRNVGAQLNANPQNSALSGYMMG